PRHRRRERRRNMKIWMLREIANRGVPRLVELLVPTALADAAGDEHEDVQSEDGVGNVSVSPDLGVVTTDREEHGWCAVILLRQPQRQCSFEHQQTPFHVDAAAETGERSVRADDA